MAYFCTFLFHLSSYIAKYNPQIGLFQKSWADIAAETLILCGDKVNDLFPLTQFYGFLPRQGWGCFCDEYAPLLCLFAPRSSITFEVNDFTFILLRAILANPAADLHLRTRQGFTALQLCLLEAFPSSSVLVPSKEKTPAVQSSYLKAAQLLHEDPRMVMQMKRLSFQVPSNLKRWWCPKLHGFLNAYTQEHLLCMVLCFNRILTPPQLLPNELVEHIFSFLRVDLENLTVDGSSCCCVAGSDIMSASCLFCKTDRR